METISESKNKQRKMVVIHSKEKRKKRSRTMHLRKIDGNWHGAGRLDAWTLADYGKDLPFDEITIIKK